MPDLRLIIIDVDGTLVDSQSEIVAAMDLAHKSVGMPTPERTALLSIVGLSLPEGFAKLHLGIDGGTNTQLCNQYREAYRTLRTAPGAQEAAFYPGLRDVIEGLRTQDHTLLAVATGKSRRGLDRLIGKHDLEGVFLSTQVADNHPSKPNPSMIYAAMRDCGVEAGQTTMIGDTTFDMQMAKSAGVRAVGVTWGYHAACDLDADVLVDTADQLQQLLNKGQGA